MVTGAMQREISPRHAATEKEKTRQRHPANSSRNDDKDRDK